MSRGSRRALLAAALPAALAAGCGSSAAPDAGGGQNNDRGSQAQGDIEMLSFLLGIERRSIATLQAASGPVAERALAHDREHAARLISEIRRIGGPVPDSAGTPLASPEDAKRTALAAYLDALPKLYDDDLQALAARIFAVEAEHLAALTGATPNAFVTGENRS